MGSIATAPVPEKCRAKRPTATEDTVDIQRLKAGNDGGHLYGHPRIIVPAGAPCPPWCRHDEHPTDQDDDAQMHVSPPRTVTTSAGGPVENGEAIVQVQRVDVPGELVDEPTIWIEGADQAPMTLDEACQLAAALIAAVQDARR